MPPDVEDSGPQPLLFVALMVALSTAASTFSGSTPMLAAFLGQEWHYSPADVGWTVTVFTLGTTLGAVASSVTRAGVTATTVPSPSVASRL